MLWENAGTVRVMTNSSRFHLRRSLSAILVRSLFITVPALPFSPTRIIFKHSAPGSRSISAMSEDLPRVDFTQTQVVGSTRWMRLETISYRVPSSDTATVRTWDRAVRTTKQSETSVDAVVILAILKFDSDPSNDRIVCVKQFRPPVNAYTIELPAGLIDVGEDLAQAAEREFREETGYSGTVVRISPPSVLSPGLTNESASMVQMEVDMTLPQNIDNHHRQNNSQEGLLEGCEKERGLEKLLLPRLGLLNALHDLQKRDGVQIFAALYSLALGMSFGEGCTDSNEFPLVTVKLSPNEKVSIETAHQVTSALRKSGFLLMKSPMLPLELQRRALTAASKILALESSETVLTHPSDPKLYAMLQQLDFDIDGTIDQASVQDLKEWYTAVRATKDILLNCIAVGLGMMDDVNFFVNLHSDNNDSLRLIFYPTGDENTGNRCKEHSDYGSLTLLLTDGVEGLEAFVNGEWRPIPHVEGAITVNIGSIMSTWTRQELPATLHRVAGPTSVGSQIPKQDLLRAVARPRTSIAYFADPNGDISIDRIDTDDSERRCCTVDEYIYWRSGKEAVERDGIALTTLEADRLNKGVR